MFQVVNFDSINLSCPLSYTFHIKNMVCNRCIEAVKADFASVQLTPDVVKLGEVMTLQSPTAEQKEALVKLLAAHGFELLENKAAQVIGRIKSLIIQRIHHEPEALGVNFSTYLSQSLGQDYSSLSRLFSSVEGITIEKYIVRQRVERVKEMLFYQELTLSEIAYALHYSSVAHLSAQFKKETGMSPSAFKKSRPTDRKPLDAI